MSDLYHFNNCYGQLMYIFSPVMQYSGYIMYLSCPITYCSGQIMYHSVQIFWCACNLLASLEISPHCGEQAVRIHAWNTPRGPGYGLTSYHFISQRFLHFIAIYLKEYGQTYYFGSQYAFNDVWII